MSKARCAADAASIYVSVTPSGGDDTAVLQSILSAGLSLDLQGRSYKANNLIMSVSNTRIISTGGVARITKNANGPILTITGDDCEIRDVGFRGDASTPTFTGDNIVASGARPRFINCGSRWAYGHALRATGTGVQVIGTCDIWQTADTSGTGYDIVIGLSGTATLYHHLENVYSSQSTGGIYLLDTGSHSIVGGQFGKLSIAAGTKPSGVNGGKTIGARILGNVVIEQSSALFAGCQFGAVAITFASGTSGCSMGVTNTYQAGHTITNAGNANNLIQRETSTGSFSLIKTGDDSSVHTERREFATGDHRYAGNVYTPNNKRLYLLDSTGAQTNAGYLGITSGDAVQLGTLKDAGNVQIAAPGAGVIQLRVNSADVLRLEPGLLRLNGSGGPTITVSSATPEGAVTAPVGSLHINTSGGAGTTFYVKQTGTGNTGWVGK